LVEQVQIAAHLSRVNLKINKKQKDVDGRIKSGRDGLKFLPTPHTVTLRLFL
jgi:hypothetical protein